ncbi:MAG: acyltransferase domain-containing protein, partial [Oscillochloris sp.]|nr:acyltransferase domain-containing protein [Oscillochloris sp.]
MDRGSDIVLRSPINNADMRTVVEIQTWLAEQIAELTGCPVESISINESFDSFGLASRDAVALSGDLEEWLSRTLSPTLIYEHPSIEALARFLAGGALQPGPVSAVAVAPIADLPQGRGEPIAIVGLGCRFPGADGPAAFWQLLYDGVDAISEVPPDRWNLTHLYDPRPGVAGKLATRWGGFLDRVDQFDARFFGISPREASRMDPQQRVLLEVAWEALEHAGLPVEQLAGSQTGVFVGVSSSDYALLQYGDPTLIDAYAGTGNATSIAANRLSYVFDLRGPSVAIDTACSSSLVAMHMACQSLRSGESDVAMAGGVNLMVSPELTITFSHARMMATDGRCKTFDASADGYVRGEGCGVVVLKRLTDAQRDGDRILALVRGSAINQDGRSNGLTAPSGLAQQAVVRAALRDAAVTPDQVGYIEAHGTGTALGDPIELRALGAVFAGRPPSAPCMIGSAKTNIGHLEAAAGVAGLIKVVLSLVNQSIPPHLHLREVNPHIPLAELPFSIPTTVTPWPTGEQRRIAGVSSFGFGGTNAHVVLEEAPAFVARIAAQDAERPRHVLALSARDEAALCELAGRYAAHLAAQPSLDLRDFCYSANTGRSHLPVRLGLSAGSRDELVQRLAAVAVGGDPAGAFRGMVPNAGRPKVAFLFTGQGSQYAGMGRTLYQSQPVFRAALDRCAAILDQELDYPLLNLLFDGDASTLRGPLDQTGYTQPALFAIEYALAQLWISWGVQPDALLGHSVGEYAAACLAGVMTLEEAAPQEQLALGLEPGPLRHHRPVDPVGGDDLGPLQRGRLH